MKKILSTREIVFIYFILLPVLGLFALFSFGFLKFALVLFFCWSVYLTIIGE